MAESSGKMLETVVGAAYDKYLYRSGSSSALVWCFRTLEKLRLILSLNIFATTVYLLLRGNTRACLCLLLLSVPLLGLSQHSIQENASLERMLQVYAQKNKAQESVRAWRIQVAAMTERRSMENEKVRFENLYPYYRLEWTYDNPYYLLKIRGRAYQDKLDALHLLHQLKDRFPSSILVLDDVKREDLLETSNR